MCTVYMAQADVSIDGGHALRPDHQICFPGLAAEFSSGNGQAPRETFILPGSRQLKIKLTLWPATT